MTYIVTLDGPAGVGKTTLAQRLEKDYDFYLLPSGSVYRLLTYLALKKGLWKLGRDFHGENLEKLTAVNITFSQGEIFVDGSKLGQELRSAEVENSVALFSSYKEIRNWINQFLRTLASQHRLVVAEGRDMGTEVFPDAKTKFFLFATEDVRVQRCLHRSGSFEKTKINIQKRDSIDSQKKQGRLRMAADAQYIDVTSLTFDQVYGRLVALLESAKVVEDGDRWRSKSIGEVAS